MAFLGTRLVAIFCATLLPTAVLAEEAVVEKLKHGEVNWTDRTIMATGSGAPNLKLPNVAAVRLNAERAAQLAAYRNVLEALKGVRLSSEGGAEEILGNGQIRAQVEGIIRGCKTVDTRYFSDYGVDVVVKCPLDGALHAVLHPAHTNQTHKKAEEAEKKWTGIVIDASAVGALKPALAPKLLTGGKPLYSQDRVDPAMLRSHGAVAYHSTLEAAKKDRRVGDNPLVIKAVQVVGSSDIEVNQGDLAQLEGTSQQFLDEGRVSIAIGGGAS